MPTSLAEKCTTFCETIEYKNIIGGNCLRDVQRYGALRDDKYIPMTKGMFLWIKPLAQVNELIAECWDAPLWLAQLSADEPCDNKAQEERDAFNVQWWGSFKNGRPSNDLASQVTIAATPASPPPCPAVCVRLLTGLLLTGRCARPTAHAVHSFTLSAQQWRASRWMVAVATDCIHS